MGMMVQDLLDRRVGTGLIAFDDSEFPATFPFARWNEQTRNYHKYWRHWTGERWSGNVENLKDEATREPIPKYPLKINFLATAAKKHAAVLIGDVKDSTSPAIPAKIEPRKKLGEEKGDDAAIHDARILTDFVNEVWDENSGKALQYEAALISQFLGGIVFGVRWMPWEENLDNKIRVEYILPDFFMPIWDTGHPDNLLEAWIVWRVPLREAQLRFGYDDKAEDSASGGGGPLYIEHWTKKTIHITVGGKPLSYSWKGETVKYDNAPNPFGLVPFVYIPRKRAGSYYGLSLVDDIEGLEEEMNTRLADLGDLLRDLSQPDIFATDMPNRALNKVDLGKGREAWSLGNTPPGGETPKMFTVDPPKLPDGMIGFPNTIQKLLEFASSTPAITFGEDQGSQRSGMTLITRFWSLTSEAVVQRFNWEIGLGRVAKIICTIASTQEIAGINKEMLLRKQWHSAFAPMLPKDREQMLNEGVLLASEHAIHPSTLAERMEWVEDPEGEYERAMEHYKNQMDIEGAAMAKAKDESAKVARPSAQAGATKN